MTSDHLPPAISAEEQLIKSKASPPLTIIGIGASAGGLTALRNLLHALPGDSGLTFVIVVHLSPEHESILAELLQPYSPMPVLQVNGYTVMQPNHVYVIPPAKSLVVNDNALDLRELTPDRGRPMQIDSFFRSLAEKHGDGGAIILSGSGSDGAVGIQAIKEKGGLLLVQSPMEAEYDGMPRSAIATGLVDIVGTVAELASQLVVAKQIYFAAELPVEGEPLSAPTEEILTQILTQLRLRTGHDFSGYKRATLLRRLARQMQLTQSTTLAVYLQRLRNDGNEADALFRDLLINVTEFFRDREAWLALEATVIPQLFAGKGAGDSVRVWTVGCATGEEAYSLAMLLLEYTNQLVTPPTIQIFASDLGKTALDFARAGYYPEAIADDLTEERLTRFFIKENSHYRVRPEIRESILFTQHNLLQDPPFSKLDLIVCRNLLIYIQRELQEKVFETFSYALRPGGYLFLGNAESADSASSLFDTLDKRHRLYQRRAQSHPPPLLPALPHLSRLSARPPSTSAGSTAQTPQEEHRLLLESSAPPSILVDRDYRLLHISETAGRYLLTPGGQPTTDLLKVVRPELQLDLRAALFRAFEEGKSNFTPPVPVQFNGAPHLVYLFVRPSPQAGGATRALVVFLEDETPVAPAALTGSVTTETVHQLASELRHTQDRLQGAREAYETTVEELRAANEELQSTNEEYKSTLEELETSKEELQSINEELQTINQELKSKVEEVTQTHDDLQNLFVATNIATLFLDRQLQVKRYTPRAADLFNLMPPDRGRPIAHLRSNLNYPDLESDAQQVLQSLVPTEREVTSQAGRWYFGQVRPYRTIDDRIDGVVITFVDISAIKQTEEALRNSEARFRSALEAMLDAALLLTPIYDATQTFSDFRIAFASRVALNVAKLRHDEVVGRNLTAVFPAIAATGLLATYRQVFERQSAVTTLFFYQEKVGAYANGRWIEAHISPMQEGIIAVWHDVTAWKEAEAGLQRLNETLEERVAERTTQVRALASTLTLAEQEERRRISQILHDDLQQQLYGIQMRVLSIINDVAANNQSRLPRYAQEVYDWIGKAIQTTRQLTVDLSPPVLKTEGLADALTWLASQMAAVNGLQVEIRALHPCVIPREDMRVLLFQSVRELLFNVVKHAATDHATVELTETTTGELRIVVSDEGRGFDVTAAANKQGSGFGLFSVRERLSLFAGRMSIESAPGQGTQITIHIPIAS